MVSRLACGEQLAMERHCHLPRAHAEIGIRLAVGARPLDVRLEVGRRALGLTGAGLVIGLGAVLIAGRTVEAIVLRDE